MYVENRTLMEIKWPPTRFTLVQLSNLDREKWNECFFFPSLNSKWLKKRCYKGAERFKRSSVRSTLCSSNEMWSRSRYVGVASPRIYNSPMYKNQAEIQQRARLTSQRQLTCVVSDANDGKHRKNILGDPTKFHKVVSQSFSHPYFAKYTQLFVRVMQPYSKQTML